MVALRLIGYWRSEIESTRWPDVRDFVDAGWPAVTRQAVADYLARGRTLEQYRGLSPCRFCGRHNGSKEFTDETYCWPEGLAHYLVAHAVRLPDEFVRHVKARITSADGTPSPEFDDLGQRLRDGEYDNDYRDWMATNADRFRRAGHATASWPNWLNAEIDPAWWEQQVGFGPRKGDRR